MRVHFQKQNQTAQSIRENEAAPGPVPTHHKQGAAVAFDFGRIPIVSQSPMRIQPKLMVSAPGDLAEQEADRISEQVLRSSPPGESCSCGGSCAKCQAEPGEHDTHGLIQTKRMAPGVAGHIEAPALLHQPMRSLGEPLDSSTRTFMETRFGYDFSWVRVHTDGDAAERASAVRARAYTLGQDIVMGAGEYAPASQAGRQLIAHELVHVVQQSGGGAVIQRLPKAGNPPPASAAPQPMELEIVGSDTDIKEPIAVMADRWARDNGGRVLRVSSIENMIQQIQQVAQGRKCVGKLVIWYHGAPEIQLLVGENPIQGKRLPASGFTRQWLQLDKNREALNRFRHLFCCNAMMQWIGCGTEAVKAPGGLRSKQELDRNPWYANFPDSYASPDEAERHGAKLPGASFGKINVQAWANATCTTIRGATDYVTLIPDAKEPITIDNGGTWNDITPDHECPCDPATARIAGEAPTRAEMVKSWQKQTAAAVRSKDVIWHELLLALRTGLPHPTEVLGVAEQREQTFGIQPGTLPAALREEMHHRKDHRRGPLESYYTGKVLFPMLQIAAEGIVPPAPLPNVPMPPNIWLTIASGGSWAAVTQQHLAVTRPDDFWLWIVFNDQAIGETPDFTRTVIEHELEHAADYKRDLTEFEAANPRPASPPPREVTVPADESAVRNFSGEWGKYINDFIDFRKSRTRPDRHLEIILQQRTAKTPDGNPTWDRWSAGERAYWFQLVMNNLPPDVGKDAVLPGEDQVLDAFRTGGAALQLAAIERAYATVKRAICPPKEAENSDVEAWRANARTLVQHFEPIMKHLFPLHFETTTQGEVLNLLRRPARERSGLACNL